jgi:putative flippase GtrA
MEAPARWYKQVISDRRFVRIFRYLLIGGGTTLISFGTFWVLGSRMQINPHAANAAAVACAITFAYIANKIYVFNSRSRNLFELLKEIWRFLISRAFTMLTEIGGLFILHNLCKIEPLPSKAAVSVIVLLLNYIFFRFVVFL